MAFRLRSSPLGRSDRRRVSIAGGPAPRALDRVRAGRQLWAMRRNLRTGRAAAACPTGSRAARRPAALAALVRLTLGGLAFVGPLAACGGGERDATTGDTAGAWLARTRTQARNDTAGPKPCEPGTDEAVRLAVTDYVKTAQPRPQRFLAPVGSDSAIPEGAMRALQDRGPTYLFPGAATLQAQVRQQLHDKGDYTTMLVVLRGATRRDSTVSVVVEGHYVGGEEEGRRGGPRRYQATCSAGSWTVASAGPGQTT